jgi:hypothetical protein
MSEYKQEKADQAERIINAPQVRKRGCIISSVSFLFGILAFIDLVFGDKGTEDILIVWLIISFIGISVSIIEIVKARKMKSKMGWAIAGLIIGLLSLYFAATNIITLKHKKNRTEMGQLNDRLMKW